MQLRACSRKPWRSSHVKQSDLVRRCWSLSCRGWQVSCCVDDRYDFPDLILPLLFTGLIVESLKTMRNSFGVLDGTLQLLKVALLPSLFPFQSPPFYTLFCFPSRPVPLSASSISAGRLIQQICWNIRCATPNFTTAQQYHLVPAGEAHVLRPHAASLISSLLDVAGAAIT